MRELNLAGLKVTIMGAALTACGLESPLFLYGGLAVMAVGICLRDRIYPEENREK